MKFLCRVDDFGWGVNESSTPPIKMDDRGLELAQRFHAAMGSAPYMAGVIARSVDAWGLAWLRSDPDGLTPAIHGWDHGAWCPDERDEFSWLTETQARERLMKCQRKIGPTPYLIPPYNATAQILLETAWYEGVRYLFGAPRKWPTPPTPHQVGRLWIVPAWWPLYGGSRFAQGESPNILESLAGMDLEAPGHAVITLHIGWEAARHPDFDGVKEFVGRVRNYLVTPEEYVGGICQ